MKVKEESEKVVLKLNIQKSNIMAYCLITSWEIDGETEETMTDFIFGGSKITADGDSSHEIKRCLLLGNVLGSMLDRFGLEKRHSNSCWFERLDDKGVHGLGLVQDPSALKHQDRSMIREH